jgi:hypothetical protein
MKILSERTMDIPLLFTRKFCIPWSRSGDVCAPLGVVTLTGKVCSRQDVSLKHAHVIDRAMIVQLSREEAAQFGLVTAIGIIEGKKL